MRTLYRHVIASFRLSGSILAAALVAMLLLPGVAEAKFVFPYNHPELEWYTIETDHFYVHYPVSKNQDSPYAINPEFSARKMAAVAEEMWVPMTTEFEYYLQEKVHIVLLDQSDYLEGFTIPSWDWIEVSANPGTYFYRMRGRMEWFSDVLVHEFAHVVSLKEQSALHEGVQGILIGGLYRDGLHGHEDGAELFILDTDPFWWTEGGAEYWSDNTGYNWWTASRDANLRTTVLEDRLLTYDEWITRIDKRDWGDGERGYQQGYCFALYLRERFGEGTYAQFGQVASERWRMNWETIVEEVTGVPLRQLYDDWVAYLKHKYTARWDEVRAEGEVVGMELLAGRPDFQYEDPDGKDEFMDQRQGDREDAIENPGGTWDYYALYSPDGRFFAENARGALVVKQIPEHMWPAFAGDYPSAGANNLDMRVMGDMTYIGPTEFGAAFDFVPGRDAIVMTGSIHDEKLSPVHFETRGYDFKHLAIIDLEPQADKRKHRGKRVEYDTIHLDKKKDLKRRYTPIPNTMRGFSPAVSPDGQKVAFLLYRDGTLNLAVVNIDGTDKQMLTDFDDGTWMQHPDWSPDGSQIVVSIFRNYQQDLYIVNADGSGTHALNRDEWEDLDAHWAADGTIYFSSDATGIYNIYRYDPESRRVHQITNVIGSAYMPSITPGGNLLYMLWTGHGWKNYGLSSSEFLEADVTDLFGLEFEDEEVQEELAFREDLSGWATSTRKYRWGKAIMPATAVPIFRLENDTLTNYGLSAGLQVFIQDYAEKHGAVLYFMAGEDPLFLFQYFNQMGHGDLVVFGYHYQAKYDIGYLIDDDGDPTTTDDQRTYDARQHQFVNIGGFSWWYPWNRGLQTFIGPMYIEYGFKNVSDKEFTPFMRSVVLNAGASYSNVRARYGEANPRGGRAIDFDYQLGFTDVVYEPYNGVDVDDGQFMDEYWYNRFELTWTEHLAMTDFGLGALEFVKTRRHTVQLSANLGFVDRNVNYQDEFRAGGLHPYYVGSGTIQPNNQFSGYPGYSLSGETMIVLGAAYRFPIFGKLNKKIGPLYTYDLTMQVGGTAGNLWSFRPPEEDAVGEYFHDDWGNRVAYDSSSVKREIPFFDEAYKNGNYVLFDAIAEWRLNSVLMGIPWNSFVRLAWGFNEIRGIGDVSGDDVYDTTDTPFGNSLSNETKKPGLRLYVGVGTGW
jgi:hypothetical protein